MSVPDETWTSPNGSIMFKNLLLATVMSVDFEEQICEVLV